MSSVMFDLMFDKSKFYLFVGKGCCMKIKYEDEKWSQNLLPDMQFKGKIQPSYFQFDSEEELSTRLTMWELIS